MSTHTEALSMRHRAPWRPWLISLAIAVVLAAGLGSYLALSHGSARQAPAIVPKLQSPAVVQTPQIPRQVSGTNVPGVPLPPDQTKPAEKAGPRSGASSDPTGDCRSVPPGEPC
jgi:hypothetical protein